MKIITLKELQSKLATSKGAKIVTLTTLTYPDVTKDCPHKNIFKVQSVNGVVNFNYSNSVNNQLEREGKPREFVPEKRKWGTRLNDSPFVSHVKQDGTHHLYLEMKVEKTFGIEYKTSEGEVIPNHLIEQYLKKPKSQKEHQGVNKEIVVRDFDVKNIVAIYLLGYEYLIMQED